MNNEILKICGIREALPNYDGIDLLWFNFMDISKRKISIEKAKSIKTPDSVMRVGLFW
jgi:phosphoribosylanthranilate isomerase